MHKGFFTFGLLHGVIYVVATFFYASFCRHSIGAQLIDPPPQTVVRLTLEDYLRLVLQRNETVQIRLLEAQISESRFKAERGIFEPELVVEYDYLESRRQNSAEQRQSLDVAEFEEKNNIYNGGLESLLPSGAKVRLGYTLRDLRNNLLGASPFFPAVSGGFTNQYSTFVGLTLTQPLLKNAGRAASMANIRVAALASDIAFQEYRRQLMLLVSSAEAAYWNLYMAQEQLLFFRESVELAETILTDNRERLKAGRGSQLEVMEAEAALALRRSRRNEAWQSYHESANRMAMLYSESVFHTNRLIIAVEAPRELPVETDYFLGWQNAFELNPDYVSQHKKLLQENVRLAYAKNQRWPQLDLKASYGLNGLGETPWESWDNVERKGYPTWSLGFELRIPLGGGIGARHERDAARLRVQQSLLTLKEIETQIANGLDTARRKVHSSYNGIQSYRQAVDFTRSLLETQLARLDVGRIESRKVLETEADLFDARNAVVEAMVNHRRALLEWELIQGSVLDARQMEVSQDQLMARTSSLVRKGEIRAEDYSRFVRQVEWEYRKNENFERPSPPAHNYSLPLPAQPVTSSGQPMSDDEVRRALEVLRETQSPFDP